MATVDELIAEARSWIGVPFRHQGRSRLGVDCAGLLVVLLRQCRALPYDFQEPRAYPRRPNGELRGLVERHCVRTRKPGAGVLVLICWPHDTEPRHVALCTGCTLIHSYQRSRGVVEHSYRDPWLRDTHSLWLMPNVDYSVQTA